MHFFFIQILFLREYIYSSRIVCNFLLRKLSQKTCSCQLRVCLCFFENSYCSDFSVYLQHVHSPCDFCHIFDLNICLRRMTIGFVFEHVMPKNPALHIISNSAAFQSKVIKVALILFSSFCINDTEIVTTIITDTTQDTTLPLQSFRTVFQSKNLSSYLKYFLCEISFRLHFISSC